MKSDPCRSGEAEKHTIPRVLKTSSPITRKKTSRRSWVVVFFFVKATAVVCCYALWDTPIHWGFLKREERRRKSPATMLVVFSLLEFPLYFVITGWGGGRGGGETTPWAKLLTPNVEAYALFASSLSLALLMAWKEGVAR